MPHLYLTHKGDPRGRALADRHYSRQSIGNIQFCRPGRNVVMRTLDNKAALVFWRGIADHQWDAWENTLFRNEGPILSSELLLEATSHLFYNVIGAEVPPDGLISFVSKSKVRSTNPGFCYFKAGWSLLHENEKYRILQLKAPPAQRITLTHPQMGLL
jgi:hypothetical protein